MSTPSNSRNTTRSAMVAELMQTMMVIGRSGHGNDSGRLLRTHGFSVPQLPMLFHIAAHEEGCSIKEIASRLNITSSAATQLVQTLLRRGMLRKTTDPHDRRAVSISMTPAGKREFAAFRKGMLSRMEQSFNAVPDAELQEMISLFKKILSYIQPLNSTKE